MTAGDKAKALTLGMWSAVVLSLLFWIAVGYSWPVCLAAVLPLLAPLNGLVRGYRRTYAWATLLTVPYLVFALTELLVNPKARWAASVSLILVFGWFCTLVLFLRTTPARRE